MKKKISKMLGVGLTLALLASLMVAATPVAADPGSLVYASVTAPSAKNKVLQPGDIDLLAVAPDGVTMFVYDAGVGLLKTTDAGVKWTAPTATNLPTTGVIAMAVSPNYETDGTLVATTTTAVWYSSDGGATFANVAPTDLGVKLEGDPISSIDIGNYYSDGTLSLLVGVKGTSATYSNVLKFKMGTWLWTEIGGTAGLTDSVLAVSYSPSHLSDAEIVAVSTNTTNTNLNTQYGTNAWDINIKTSTILAGQAASGAVIAFGDDYMGLASNTVLVGLQGTTADDVYRISGLSLGSPGTSKDINVTTASDNPVKSIAVSGAIATAKVMVGLTGSNVVYRSSTIAATTPTWYSSATAGGKNPTGTANTIVLWVGGVAYAGTTGADSAFSKSVDDGNAFNQMSLIDVGTIGNMSLVNSTIIDADTIFLVMNNSTGGGYAARSLFATADGGTTWQRVFTGATTLVEVSPDYATDSTLYVADGTVLIRKSTDGGTTFTVVGAPAAVTALAVVDADSYFSGAASAKLYKSGRWSSATGLSDTITSIVLSNDYATDSTILVGNNDGDVYISTDDGVKFTRVGADDSLGDGATVSVAFDPDFATNSTIYAGSTTPTVGVKRATSTSLTATWSQLDDDSNGLIVNGLAVGADGTLYAASGNASMGIRRSLDPTTAIDAIAGTAPTFESLAGTVTTGTVTHDFKLGTTAVLQNLVLISGSNVLYAIDSTKTNTDYGYQGALLTITDTLAAGPAATSPKSHMKWQSRAKEWYEQIDQISTATTATLDWADLSDADSYKYKYVKGTTTTTGTATSSKASLSGLTGGAEYCWTVRVETPVLSRYSVGGAEETCYKFITALESITSPTATYTPVMGASAVPVKPSFSWPTVTGATGYEIIVSTDPDFGIVDYAVSVTTNTFVISEPLEYETTYYWGVRAISSAASGEAWRYLSFTTGAEPEEAIPPVVITEPTAPEPPVIEVVEVPVQTVVQQAIPTYLLWLIIGVGAVLVIALIVLIVRTRRVA